MAAGQPFQESGQFGHRQEAGALVAAGVLGHEEPGRPVVAVKRDAVAGEVDEHAVVWADLGREFLGEEASEAGQSDVLG